MNKELLKRDSLIYLAQIVGFTLIFIFKPQWSSIGIGVLLLLLILSSLLIRQQNSTRNIWTIRSIQIINVNAVVMFILFTNLTLLHWDDFELVEKIYLALFSLVQLYHIQIKKVVEIKG